MDPNANLKEQVQLARRIIAIADDDENEDTLLEQAERAERLAELVIALHDWIIHGGFLPSPWRTRVS